MKPRRFCLHATVAVAAWAGVGMAWPQTVVTVAAASDLKFALEAVQARFEHTSGQKLRLVLGSSGNLYTQIVRGAPFHLFMSADEQFVRQLAEAGLTQDGGRMYARGRIGILVPKGSPLKADGQLQDLAAALKDGRLAKFAIANPEHAPYGMRAMEALQHKGVWRDIQPRLVLGENVSQAAQFAVSGGAQGGIVAYSLALAPAVAASGQFALIPADWHRPLEQRMVLLKNAPQAARDFYEYLGTPEAREILRQHGFSVPAP